MRNALLLSTAVVVLIATGVAGHYVGEWWEGEEARGPRPDSSEVGRQMSWSDLVDATMPEEVTTYQTPDAGATRTECFQLPQPLWPDTWTETHRRPTGGERAPGRRSSGARPTGSNAAPRFAPPSVSYEPSTPSGGRGYVIIPTTAGSPRLSVGPSEVVASGFLPDGTGRTWTYDVPKPDWQVWLDAGAGLSSDLVPLTAGRIRGVHLESDARIWLRYNRLRSYVGAGLDGGRVVGRVGIRTRFLSYSWN